MKISEPAKKTRRPKKAFHYYVRGAHIPKPLVTGPLNYSTLLNNLTTETFDHTPTQPFGMTPVKGGETTKHSYLLYLLCSPNPSTLVNALSITSR